MGFKIYENIDYAGMGWYWPVRLVKADIFSSMEYRVKRIVFHLNIEVFFIINIEFIPLHNAFNQGLVLALYIRFKSITFSYGDFSYWQERYIKKNKQQQGTEEGGQALLLDSMCIQICSMKVFVFEKKAVLCSDTHIVHLCVLLVLQNGKTLRSNATYQYVRNNLLSMPQHLSKKFHTISPTRRIGGVCECCLTVTPSCGKQPRKLDKFGIIYRQHQLSKHVKVHMTRADYRSEDYDISGTEVESFLSSEGPSEVVVEGAEQIKPWWVQFPKRWVMVLLCFTAFLLCNMDRVNMSIAILPMSHQFNWNSATVGLIQSSFFWGYLLTQIVGGIWADKIGGKLVLGFGVVWWSVATILTPIAAKIGLPFLLVMRAFMGIGEAHSSPQEDPELTAEEKRLILGSSNTKEPVSVIPWKLILSKPPVWALIISHFCHNWGTFILLTWMPTYYNQVLKFNLTESGLLCVLPWLTMAVFANIGGWIADTLVSKDNAINWVLGAGLLPYTTEPCQDTSFSSPVHGMQPDNHSLGIFSFLIEIRDNYATIMFGWGRGGKVGSDAFSQSGLYSNHQDIGPRYAGVLLGLSNTAGVLAGVFGTAATGYILQKGSWDDVFKVSVALYIIGTVVWNLFSTGEKILD
ncbi:major facilitator superfamily protein [Actinidia rufa]|uniref:Major facilitator superfamily protein n=1 Tax=Actinidia rufa TaxID=165716 RepID=A0A7J0F1G1_9ERIC|nr:major facilitator superfamily protein [Actinidia rufa]